MSKINYQRQSGIINIKDFRDNKTAIIGCGAIGSFVGISLAKMGLTKFDLYDFDKVEAHNLPNQFFGVNDIGKNKAVATAKYMENFNDDVEIETKGKLEKTSPYLRCQIVISCVDKMDIRKILFQKTKEDKSTQLFIDTRMAGFEGHIYVVDMADKEQVKYYESTLFDDKDAVQVRCTERSILFTVMGIASLVCNQIIKAFKGDEIKNYLVLDYIVPQMMG